ncbi:hypothetical protein APHAL10511_000983 [Amanita phalloides]|nr:hypothetical protein APHAL10511_000983 [Amanita phalloides]
MTHPILNVHTPSSSFALIYPLVLRGLEPLYDELTRKVHTRVGPGWLKYEFNGTVWNLDDDSDYTIFTWRHQQHHHPPAAMSSNIHLHDPTLPLPKPPEYQNLAYYVFRRQQVQVIRSSSPGQTSLAKSKRSHGSGKSSNRDLDGSGSQPDDGVPAFKREFEKFHSENGVRTVIGSIGPVNNVRMLLKSGYRHVYMSRKFALKHRFIPPDATPGYYGYGGLVNLGLWPVTLTPASSSAPPSISPSHLLSRPSSLHTSLKDGHDAKKVKPKTILVPVYLSEEPHFDVVLGRSFLDRRQIRLNAIDPTDVVCLDTGERIECELVILKDGRGEIVTVT